MESIPHLRLFLIITSIAGAVVVTTWRLRESRGTVTARSILIPPLGMSTGFLMFLAPPARVPWSWALVALLLGALVLSYPLARTSRLTRTGNEIRMERSRAFLWILVGLVAVRFVLRSWVEQRVTPLQTGAIFFILAFGMIARWRTDMFLRFRQLRAEIAAAPPAVDLPAAAAHDRLR